jgi:hypothetical protein
MQKAKSNWGLRKKPSPHKFGIGRVIRHSLPTLPSGLALLD